MGSLMSFVKHLFSPGAALSNQISPREAYQRMQGAPALQLIDVRTEGERHSGYIAQSRLIPLHDLENQLGKLDKAKPIIVYCRSGHRSGMALRLLMDKGFTEVSHIQGGLMGWLQNGLPVERK